MRKALDFEKTDSTKLAEEAQAIDSSQGVGNKINNRKVNDETDTPYAHNIS